MTFPDWIEVSRGRPRSRTERVYWCGSCNYEIRLIDGRWYAFRILYGGTPDPGSGTLELFEYRAATPRCEATLLRLFRHNPVGPHLASMARVANGRGH